MVANSRFDTIGGVFFFGFAANFMPLWEIEEPTALRTSSSKSESSIKGQKKKKEKKVVLNQPHIRKDGLKSTPHA